MNENRGPWYLLTGLILGFLVGLFYAWAIQPVEYVDTIPGSLRADFKDKYRVLIASAYTSQSDLVRAKARLELLGDQDIFRVLAEQAQRTLAEDGSSEEARSLGLLAIALGQGESAPAPVMIRPASTATITLTLTPTASATFTATPKPTGTPTPSAMPTETLTPTETTTHLPIESPTPEESPTPDSEATATETPIPRPTDTPTFTPTPTLTPGAPFVLVDSKKICEDEQTQPIIQIIAETGDGQPLSGILITITWDTGEEQFYTGLQPERGVGYADFTLTPGVIYALRLGEGGETAAGLSAVQCTAMGGRVYWGAWALKFVQP